MKHIELGEPPEIVFVTLPFLIKLEVNVHGISLKMTWHSRRWLWLLLQAPCFSCPKLFTFVHAIIEIYGNLMNIYIYIIEILKDAPDLYATKLRYSLSNKDSKGNCEQPHTVLNDDASLLSVSVALVNQDPQKRLVCESLASKFTIAILDISIHFYPSFSDQLLH